MLYMSKKDEVQKYQNVALKALNEEEIPTEPERPTFKIDESEERDPESIKTLRMEFSVHEISPYLYDNYRVEEARYDQEEEEAADTTQIDSHNFPEIVNLPLKLR